jgi:hypothetical protein
MKVNTTSMLTSVGNSLCTLTNTQARISPQPTPPTTIQTNCKAALGTSNIPVVTAMMANCMMMSDVASFSKLSPSKIVETRFGILTNLVMALALTASGGDTMPPSKNPNASVKPGIIQ